MKTEQLYYILKVAEVHSLSKAAESLYSSKQNISEMISSLENELGVNIFVRSSKGMFLTEAGEKIIDYAKEITAIYEKMCDINKEVKHYAIEICSHLSAIFLPLFLQKIKQAHPKLQITVEDNINSENSIKKLRQQKINLVIFDSNRKSMHKEQLICDKKLQIMPLCEDTVILLAHKLLGIKTYSDLMKMEVPILDFGSYGDTGKEVISADSRHPVISVTSIEMYKAMIESAMAIGLSTQILLNNQPWRYPEDIIYLENDTDIPNVHTTTCLAFYQSDLADAIHKSIINIAIESMQSI